MLLGAWKYLGRSKISLSLSSSLLQFPGEANSVPPALAAAFVWAFGWRWRSKCKPVRMLAADQWTIKPGLRRAAKDAYSAAWGYPSVLPLVQNGMQNSVDRAAGEDGVVCNIKQAATFFRWLLSHILRGCGKPFHRVSSRCEGHSFFGCCWAKAQHSHPCL